MQKNHRPGPQEKEGCYVPRGGGDDIYRYAYLAVYKLTQGSKRRKDVQFHRGRGETCGRTPPASEAQIPHSQPRSPEAKIEHLGL